MRKVLVLAAGLVLAATSAWSQGMSRDRDMDSRRDWRDSRDWDRDSDDRRGRMMRDHHDEDGPGGGARFFLRSGDTQLRVVCGDRESTRSCVDAALMMFDRVQSQPGSRSTSPSTPSSPPSSQ